jgi:NAD kinase
MKRQTENKIILIKSPTRLDQLVQQYNVAAQAQFYIEHLGADFSDYEKEHHTYVKTVEEAERILSGLGNVQVVDRDFLPNFIFGKDDTVVTIGRDGLVANTLKYLDGQPLLGVNPDPGRWDGILLPFTLSDLASAVQQVFLKKRTIREVTMAKASFPDGQTLYAVNDFFIGARTHISAHYVISQGTLEERHSSSGIIVSTGLGSTAWLRSIVEGASKIVARVGQLTKMNHTESQMVKNISIERSFEEEKAEAAEEAIEGESGSEDHEALPATMGWDSDFLYFSVREPFPSKTSGNTMVFGKITPSEPLKILSLMPRHGVIFSDGIESDFLNFGSGIEAVISIAEKKGRLVQ